METVAKKNMMQGMRFEWAGLALEEMESSGQSIIIFGLGLLVVFLTLSAQYKSFALPLIMLFAMPMAALGAFSAISMRALANDLRADRTGHADRPICQ